MSANIRSPEANAAVYALCVIEMECGCALLDNTFRPQMIIYIVQRQIWPIEERDQGNRPIVVGKARKLPWRVPRTCDVHYVVQRRDLDLIKVVFKIGARYLEWRPPAQDQTPVSPNPKIPVSELQLVSLIGDIEDERDQACLFPTLFDLAQKASAWTTTDPAILHDRPVPDCFRRLKV